MILPNARTAPVVHAHLENRPKQDVRYEGI
jgi:hypothetical protein